MQVAGTTTYFLYDGSHPVCEIDGSGNVRATNTWGGGLLSRHAGTASTFYTFDPSGNVAQRLDSSGNILGAYAFDAFGLRTGTDTTTDPYSSFGGQYGYYADAESGLELLGHRYYDAGTGRFINRDPLGYAGGANLYAYCGNNPMMEVDPNGTNAFSDFYWGGMGGLTDLVDKYALGGSMDHLGTVTGQYDAGCASGLDVAVAGAQVVGNVAMTVAPGGEEARGADIAAELAEHGAEDAAQNLAQKKIISFTDHSVRQLGKRGWSEEDVAKALDNPSATVITRDTRSFPKGTPAKNEPATAYYHPDKSGYVVVNDTTNEIIQLSGRDPGWASNWPSPF